MDKHARTKTIKGVTVLDNEGGNRFFHKHKSNKAVNRKKKSRKATRAARRKSRG